MRLTDRKKFDILLKEGNRMVILLLFYLYNQA